MENYIVINGRKAELTEEQLKALGIETEKKSPFSRKNGQEYHIINNDGYIWVAKDLSAITDQQRYDIANYCTDKELLQQQAYRETLNRLLWRYSMEHDGNKIDWNDRIRTKFSIRYDFDDKIFTVGAHFNFRQFGTVFFYTKEIAENAIEEIVQPFMGEHPDFKW